MSEAARHEELLAALSSKGLANPVTVGGGSHAQVDGHIEDAAAQNPDQLRLRLGWTLEMQAAQGASLGRESLIVLNERDLANGFREGTRAVGLGKPTPVIAKTPGNKTDHVRNISSVNH
jgi:hypothetical protein